MSSLPSLTLADARDGFHSGLAKGKWVKCPCCDRPAKVYRRTLNKSMIRGLLWMVWWWSRHSEEWVDVPGVAPRHIYRAQEVVKTKHWDLIERMPNVDPSKRTSGHWRPLEKGLEFVAGTLSLPQYVYLFNDEPLHFDGPMVTISDVLGIPFHYTKLLEDSDPEMFRPKGAKK